MHLHIEPRKAVLSFYAWPTTLFSPFLCSPLFRFVISRLRRNKQHCSLLFSTLSSLHITAMLEGHHALASHSLTPLSAMSALLSLILCFQFLIGRNFQFPPPFSLSPHNSYCIKLEGLNVGGDGFEPSSRGYSDSASSSISTQPLAIQFCII